MKKREWRKIKLSRLGAALWGPALFLLLMVMLFSAFGDVERTSDAEGQRLLTESLHRATLTCYAIEGAYPPNLEYLTANYGIVVDAERFAVFYDIFADNIMPDITVIPIKPQQ